MGAVISECGKYRYVLERNLGESVRTATFIMLNPSTADAEKDDHTIRKCMGFARRMDCGRLRVVNLFAFRATMPADMREAMDPVGPDNFSHLTEALRQAGCPESGGPVVCAWGTDGRYRNQDLAVIRLLREMNVMAVALKVTKDGHPCHPARPGYDLVPVAFVGRA